MIIYLKSIYEFTEFCSCTATTTTTAATTTTTAAATIEFEYATDSTATSHVSIDAY